MNNRFCIENVEIVRKYFIHLGKGIGYKESTTDSKIRDVIEYDRFLDGLDFRRLTEQIAIDYQNFLKERKWQGKEVSLKTIGQKLSAIMEFYNWLRLQPSYKSKVREPSIIYFGLPMGEKNAIKTQENLKLFPSIEHIIKLIDSIKGDFEVDMRDRALISLIILTGLRVKSITTLELEDFDIETLRITLDPLKHSIPKRDKALIVRLLVFDKRLLEYFMDWIDYLKNVKKFTSDKPIFPSTQLKFMPGTNSFIAEDVSNKRWESTEAINKILRDRSAKAGMEYFNPHSYRNTIVNLSKSRGLGIEEQSAVSQNLGHNDLYITEVNYGTMKPTTRLDILSNIDFTKSKKVNHEQRFDSLDKKMDLVMQILEKLSNNDE